jgi:hypothetical protein
VAVSLAILAGGARAAMDPGTGLKFGDLRVSPFAEGTIGYDSNVRLAEGEILQLQDDGSYQLQDEQVDDTFSQLTAGVGVSRVLVSEWDFRFRGWYDTRMYAKETDINFDSITAEGSARYWPLSDKYAVNLGGKYREAQDVERVPGSAVLTMPGELPLPYLEERDDRLKRVSQDVFGNVTLRPGERTDFTVGGTVSSVEYEDDQLLDYDKWTANAEAGYRHSEKTSFFVNGEYEEVAGDGMSEDVPVYGLRVGVRSRLRATLDYKISVGFKTYEYYKDTDGEDQDRRWDPDFDGQLNWHCTEKLSVFGKAWTDVAAAIQEQASETTRRIYSGQVGADYSFMTRLTAMGAASYRLDAYDSPIEFGQERTQEDTDLWQLMGRLTLTPRTNSFWKLFVETSYEMGDNDLDDYDQWLVWLGASVWY